MILLVFEDMNACYKVDFLQSLKYTRAGLLNVKSTETKEVLIHLLHTISNHLPDIDTIVRNNQPVLHKSATNTYKSDIQK